MRLLCFSDWRVQPIEDIYKLLSTLNTKPDLILYAGDDIQRFQQDGINHFSELASYTNQRGVLAVAGNDDFVECKAVFQTEKVHDLHNSEFIFGDFAILGLEGSTSGPGLLQHTEEQVKSHLNKQLNAVKGKTIIVLSHTPPYGTLDLGIRFADPQVGAEHIGSKALRDFVEKAKPALVVCGHCHSQGGVFSSIGTTKVVNIASHDSPGSTGNFALIEIDAVGAMSIQLFNTEDLIPPDSLLNIHGVGPSVESALSQAGITKVDQLLEAPDLYKIAESSGLPFATISRIKAKARALKDGKPFKLKDIQLITGDAIFLDVETDIACERVWLVGVLSKAGFKRFYADTWQDERSMLINFLNYLKLSPNSIIVTFSGINFDRNVLEKALRRLQLDYKLLLNFRHVDLALQIKECFIFPNQSYALKDLAAHLGYKFKYPELDGFLVALEYQHHVIDGIPLNPMLFEYNEDDVKSLPFMIDQLAKLNQECNATSIAEISITDRQKAYREFIEGLKKQGVTGAEYREKVADWNRNHQLN